MIAVTVFLSILNQMDFHLFQKIEKKTLTRIISHSMGKEMEIQFSQCRQENRQRQTYQLSERLASLGIMGAQLRAPLKHPVHHSTIILRKKEMETQFTQGCFFSRARTRHIKGHSDNNEQPNNIRDPQTKNVTFHKHMPKNSFKLVSLKNLSQTRIHIAGKKYIQEQNETLLINALNKQYKFT